MSLSVDIHKSYRGFSLDVSFDTDRECLGILGASGCGKSMTLKCIAGILTPDRGRIVLNGRVLFDDRKKINLTPQERRVGYLFQNYALFPNMTVRKNIGIGLRNLPAGAREERVSKLISSFHLAGLEDHYPGQLSGGQQQRTALARILAYEPEVLMLDEPFSALDTYLKEQLQFEVQNVLRQYAGDVLMVTHSRDEVYQFCDSAAVMDRGGIIENGDTRTLFVHPRTLITARLSGCKNFSAARKISDHQLYAEDWNICLTSEIPVSDDVRAVGIRAHDFIPEEGTAAGPGSGPDGGETVNRFRTEPADVIEGPFEISARMIVNGNDAASEERYVWWKTERAVWEKKWKAEFPPAFTVSPSAVMPLI